MSEFKYNDYEYLTDQLDMESDDYESMLSLPSDFGRDWTDFVTYNL